MIPKVIHYIWLGGNKMPNIVKKCIKSWQKCCPDYQIKRWDETNLDLNKYQFAKDAYNAKKWAFASDVFRFDILYNEGGIYLDTDVEILKNGCLDKFLNHEFFTGFETKEMVAPGLILGAEKNCDLTKDVLELYSNLKFDKTKLNDITICKITTNYLTDKYNLKQNGETQYLKNGKVVICAPDYFCPKSFDNSLKMIETENTCTVHHYAGSWVNKTPLIKRIYWKIKDFFKGKNNDKK